MVPVMGMSLRGTRERGALAGLRDLAQRRKLICGAKVSLRSAGIRLPLRGLEAGGRRVKAKGGVTTTVRDRPRDRKSGGPGGEAALVRGWKDSGVKAVESYAGIFSVECVRGGRIAALSIRLQWS